jgi:hypothetical protein
MVYYPHNHIYRHLQQQATDSTNDAFLDSRSIRGWSCIALLEFENAVSLPDGGDCPGYYHLLHRPRTGSTCLYLYQTGMIHSFHGSTNNCGAEESSLPDALQQSKAGTVLGLPLLPNTLASLLL